MINIKQLQKCFALFKKQFDCGTIDICIVTYNRLPYLQKCIWSLLGAKFLVQYRIHVFDDNSTDGTGDFLDNLLDIGVISSVRHNLSGVNLGTANALNDIIDSNVKSSWFVFANDDMWFSRFWEFDAMEIVMKNADCGMVSLYNFTNISGKLKTNVIESNNLWIKLNVTGLGATMMYYDTWLRGPRFNIDTGRPMGYFASKFCNEVSKISCERNKLYMPINPLVFNMDKSSSLLNESDYSKKIGYLDYRKANKK